MREIKYIVLHCTATSPKTSVQSILNYWKDVMKWKTPGYHFLIEAGGKIHNLVPIEKISNGVAGFNAQSIHISYVGGIDAKGNAKDTRTPEQLKQMIELIKKHKAMFPKAEVKGHRDFVGVSKACPSFDVKTWLKTVGL